MQQKKASSRLDRWMQYFSCANPQEVLAFAKQDPLFSDVLEAEKMYLSDDDQMREYYRQNENLFLCKSSGSTGFCQTGSSFF